MNKKQSKNSNMREDANESMLGTALRRSCEDIDISIDKPANEILETMTTFVIYRNLLTVSVAFMLLFSAFNSFVYLQSSLNKEEGLGTSGVAVLYVAMVLTNLFIAPLTSSKFSDKWIIVMSMLTYILYVGTGFYPAWSTIIPASIIVGTGSAHLWISVQTYITDIAKRYAHLTHTSIPDRLHLFLGIFYAFTYTSNIWGNLFSSLMFRRTSNDTEKDIKELCGHNFCPYKEMNDTVMTPPSTSQIYLYTGFCAGISSLAVFLTFVFATNISSGSKNHSVLKKLKQVIVLLFTSRIQLLLIFPSLLGGLANGFSAGDFTIAYISCPYGIENVGFVMITYGVSQSLFSLLFGKLNQYWGHIPIYIFGFITQLLAYLTLLLWSPKSSEYAVVYVISALFGIGAAINSPIISALYTLYFDKDRAVALSSFRVLNSLGWAAAFGYSSWLCTQYKIYILIFVSTLSLVSIVVLHIIFKREDKQKIKELTLE